MPEGSSAGRVGATTGHGEGLLGPEAYARLRRVLASEEGFDLDAYRPAYLARRLRARLAMIHVSPAEYPEMLERDPKERRFLMEILGVNVSSFFRDPHVWAYLEEVALPPLIERHRGAGTRVRVASLGCAGGQEAYTLAMMLNELTRGAGVDYEVDAFDVDPGALAIATAATYPPEALSVLSPQAIDRYFVPREGGLLTVAPGLRARVRVRRRDILTEQIPRGYDLAACRNMMIYLEREAKDRLLAKIHHALAPDGLLVLGQSEVVLGDPAARFQALSARHRVYRRVGP